MRKKITLQSLIPFLVKSSQAEKFQRCTELLPLHSPKPLINIIEEFDSDPSSWRDQDTCPDHRDSRTWQHSGSSGMRSLMSAKGRRFVENLLELSLSFTLLHKASHPLLNIVTLQTHDTQGAWHLHHTPLPGAAECKCLQQRDRC